MYVKQTDSSHTAPAFHTLLDNDINLVLSKPWDARIVI